MAFNDVEIMFDRPSKTYHAGERVAGQVRISTRMEIKHEGISLSFLGAANVQLSQKNAGLVEALVKPVKTFDLAAHGLELTGPGVIKPGVYTYPFGFPLDPRPGKTLYETYHGVSVSVKYMVKICIRRTFPNKFIEESGEFVVENRREDATTFASSRPVEFQRTPENTRQSSRAGERVPRFEIAGKIDSVSCVISEPFTGDIEIKQCAAKIKSIELRLTRVETSGAVETGGFRREVSDVQNIQVGEGDVCRGLRIPLYMLFPRLFTCPTLVTPSFKIEFEVNVVVVFSGAVETGGFRWEVSDVQNIQVGEGDVCRGLRIPLYMLFPRLFTCPTLVTPSFKIEFEVNVVVVFSGAVETGGFRREVSDVQNIQVGEGDVCRGLRIPLYMLFPRLFTCPTLVTPSFKIEFEVNVVVVFSGAVETGGFRREVSDVQNIQVGEGDVCRGLRIPLYMLFPRLFTCPTLVTPSFKIEFEVNVVVVFSGAVETGGFRREVSDVQNIQVGEGDVCRGLRIPLYMLFPRLFTCPTLVTPSFKIEFEVNVVVVFSGAVETGGFRREVSDVQNIQVGEGDVCRGLRIPLYMLFPRLFTCPTLVTPSFKIEFEVNVVVVFSGAVETGGFRREVSDVQNIQVGEGDVCRGLRIPLYMLFPRLFTCPTLVTPSFKIEFEVNVVVVFENDYMVCEVVPITLHRY